MPHLLLSTSLVWGAILCTLLVCVAADAAPATRPGDAVLDAYFREQTALLRDRCLANIKTLDDWNSHREEYRRELAEMLGLWPIPQRTDLKATITGRLDQPAYTVDRLHFQSRPGLYVTGNLYVPKAMTRPAPAILYLCGHSLVKKDGIAYGAKCSYQHHGDWFARNGYVCLTLDTLQLGEIEGIHHGLYREKMWWWMSRGYTPAGVEAWNGVRAIDYLASRADVDPKRIGVTGRSGGGAATWWITTMDERVACAVPVAGITDLWNHVVDGCVEGHCDCMYMSNFRRWDYPQVASLIAPRPLLLSNSDKDTIFPLDGVQRLHAKVRDIYRLNTAGGNLGLLITEGPHKDTQELQTAAFRWFNRFLKDDLSPIDSRVERPFTPEQLRVFKPGEEPRDQINSRLHESFIPAATRPVVPQSKDGWTKQRDGWMAELRGKTFSAWPAKDEALEMKEAFAVRRDGLIFRAIDFTSQSHVRLRLHLLQRDDGTKPSSVQLHIQDGAEWRAWLAAMATKFAQELGDCAPLPPGDKNPFAAIESSLGKGAVLAWLAPRGIGLTEWSNAEQRMTHIRRRFWLLGQTVEEMQAYDIRRAMQAIRGSESLGNVPLELHAGGEFAVLATYASLFELPTARLVLTTPSHSHMQGPQLPVVLQVLDIPAAVALAAERCPITIIDADESAWAYPAAVAAKLGWTSFVVRATSR